MTKLGATNSAVPIDEIRTTGPVDLTLGAVADGQFLKRSGSTVVGDAAGGTIGNEDTPILLDPNNLGASFTAFGETFVGFDMSSSGTSSLTGISKFPSNLDTGTNPIIEMLLVAPADSQATGNVKMEVKASYLTDQDTKTDAAAFDETESTGTTTIPTTAASSVGFVTASLTISDAAIAAGKQVWFRLSRLGDDGSDSYGQSVLLVWARVVFKRTQS